MVLQVFRRQCARLKRRGYFHVGIIIDAQNKMAALANLMDIPFGSFADMFNRMIPAIENRLQNPIDGKYWGYLPLAIPRCYSKLSTLYAAMTYYGMLFEPLPVTEGLNRLSSIGGAAAPEDEAEAAKLLAAIQTVRRMLEAHIPGVRAATARHIPKKKNNHFWEIITAQFLLNAVLALNTMRDDADCQTRDGQALTADKSNNLPRMKRFATNTTSSPPAGTFQLETFKEAALKKAVEIIDTIVTTREALEMFEASHALELTSRFPVVPGAAGVRLEALRARLAAATAPRSEATNVAALRRLATTAGARRTAAATNLNAETAAVLAEILSKRGGKRSTRKRKTKKNRSN